MGGSSTIEGGRRVLGERGSSTDGSSGALFRFVSYSCFYISSNLFSPVLSVKPLDYCFISASPDAHETTYNRLLTGLRHLITALGPVGCARAQIETA